MADGRQCIGAAVAGVALACGNECLIAYQGPRQQYPMINGIIFRAHSQAAVGKGGQDKALGRPRGIGLSTPVWMVVSVRLVGHSWGE